MSVLPSKARNWVCKLAANAVMLAVSGAGMSERCVPAIVTVKALKSFTDGLVPKLAPVIADVPAVPAEAPVSKLMVVAFESAGLLTTRVEVADVISSWLPL